MNISAKELINWSWKQRGPINKNLTWCSQRYVVLGYERMRNDLNANTNNSASQVIPSEHNFDFHRRAGETWRTRPRRPGYPDLPMSCRRHNFSLEQLEPWWKTPEHYEYNAIKDNR
jgi:hypothetical protein